MKTEGLLLILLPGLISLVGPANPNLGPTLYSVKSPLLEDQGLGPEAINSVSSCLGDGTLVESLAFSSLSLFS